MANASFPTATVVRAAEAFCASLPLCRAFTYRNVSLAMPLVVVYFKSGVLGINGDVAWTTYILDDLPIETVELQLPGLGRLRGIQTRAQATHRQFLGIRYAEPHPGRWRDAVPKQPWTGVADATATGPACPSSAQNDRPVDEDCLYLNIWTPAKQRRPETKNKHTFAAEATTPPLPPPLPVFVWVHGGNYLTGSGAEARYNGSYATAWGAQMIMVTINCTNPKPDPFAVMSM